MLGRSGPSQGKDNYLEVDVDDEDAQEDIDGPRAEAVSRQSP